MQKSYLTYSRVFVCFTFYDAIAFGTQQLWHYLVRKDYCVDCICIECSRQDDKMWWVWFFSLSFFFFFLNLVQIQISSYRFVVNVWLPFFVVVVGVVAGVYLTLVIFWFACIAPFLLSTPYNPIWFRTGQLVCNLFANENRKLREREKTTTTTTKNSRNWRCGVSSLVRLRKRRMTQSTSKTPTKSKTNWNDINRI